MTQYWERSNLVGLSFGLGAIVGNTSYALDAQFVLGTSGKSAGYRFLAPAGNVHVDDAWVFLHTAPGTANDLTGGLTAAGANASRAGSAYLDSGAYHVHQSGGTTSSRWVHFDFTGLSPSALTPHELYWLVVGDETAAPGGYAVRQRGPVAAAPPVIYSRLTSFTNADGWTGNGAIVAYPAPCVLKFSDGAFLGCPYTGSTTPTSDTNERGLVLDGLTAPLAVVGGHSNSSSSANISTWKIYSGTTAPGTADILSESTLAGAELVFLHQHAAVTLASGTKYRFCFDFSANLARPYYVSVEDDAGIAGALPGSLALQGRMYMCEEASGAWKDYNNATDGYRLPEICLIVQDQVDSIHARARSLLGVM